MLETHILWSYPSSWIILSSRIQLAGYFGCGCIAHIFHIQVGNFFLIFINIPSFFSGHNIQKMTSTRKEILASGGKLKKSKKKPLSIFFILLTPIIIIYEYLSLSLFSFYYNYLYLYFSCYYISFLGLLFERLA